MKVIVVYLDPQDSDAVKLEDVDHRETVNKPVLKPRPEHSAPHARNSHDSPGHQAPQSNYNAAPAMAAQQQQLIQPPAIYQVLLTVCITRFNEWGFNLLVLISHSFPWIWEIHLSLVSFPKRITHKCILSSSENGMLQNKFLMLGGKILHFLRGQHVLKRVQVIAVR